MYASNYILPTGCGCGSKPALDQRLEIFLMGRLPISCCHGCFGGEMVETGYICCFIGGFLPLQSAIR